MDWDELEPKKKPKPRDLSVLGVNELNDYIGELREEITRAEAEILKRGSHKDAAEAFFRKP